MPTEKNNNSSTNALAATNKSYISTSKNIPIPIFPPTTIKLL